MNKLMQEYSNMMDEEEGIENPNLNDIENPGTDDPSLPEGWDGDKVDVAESEDGETVPVPKGYVASKASNENTVQGGFVIYEGNEDVTDSNVDSAKTTRNQFVWIPVDDISDIANLTSDYDTAGRLNYQGKLYNFSSGGATEMSNYGQNTSTYREPDILTSYDNNASNIGILGLTSGNELQQQLQSEFNEMVESVEIYGGYYIGRYETGNLSSSAGVEPVVLQGNDSISSTNWYYMYRNSKEIAANSNVRTTMLWGCLWDRTLIWLAETNQASNGVNGKSYSEIENSRGWGNFATTAGGTGAKKSSGNSDTWKVNNIYDMAGNVYEWTLEGNSTNFRVLRGADYSSGTNSSKVCLRYTGYSNSYPYNANINIGFRVGLYIDPETKPDTPTLPEGWDEDKVEAVESGDGETVPVPKGYVASKASNENTVIGGFVIYEGEEEVTDSNVASAKTSRNQFVWVPVDDIKDIANLTSGYDTAGRLNYQGKLYNFSSSGATEMTSYGQGTNNYREPDIVDDDNVTANISIIGVTSGNELKQKLQLEFNEIIESIDIYGGFYIGRYETGNLISSIGAEPIIVKGNATISDINWYYMYRNLKELAANSNVKSTMIWGSMWDRTLIWLAEANTDSSGKYGRSYTDLISSDSWGNYNGSKQAAGYSEIWKANNIYDLAGNVEEWTVEVRTFNHVHRGGDYYHLGSEYPASYRDQWLTPTQRDVNRGTRAVLYITP